MTSSFGFSSFGSLNSVNRGVGGGVSSLSGAGPPVVGGDGGVSGGRSHNNNMNANHHHHNRNNNDASGAMEEDVDFRDLLSSSNSLQKKSYSFGGASSHSHNLKSLKEIEVASNALFSNWSSNNNTRPSTTTTTTTSFAQEASAHRLLAREGGGFDSARLGRSARDLEVKSTASSVHNVGVMSSVGVESDVSLYLQSSQSSLIRSILEDQKELRRQEEEKMEAQLLQDWKDERSRILSHIHLGRTLGSASNNNINKSSNLPASTRQVHDFSASNSGTNRTWSVTNDAAEDESLSRAMKKHYAELQSHASCEDWSVTDDEDAAGYGNAWKWIQSLKPAASLDTQITSILQHLATQYRTHIDNRIQAASQQGRLPAAPAASTGLAKQVQQYSHMELGLATSNHSVEDVTWRCLYYCIRCSDFRAAHALLQTTSNHNIDPVVVSAISHMASSNQYTSIDTNNTHLRELYNRAKTKRQNPFQIVTLALLSLAESCCDLSSVVATIEDYIYVSLWYIRYRHTNTNTNTSNDPRVTEMAQLGSIIKQWGPSYFQQNQNRDHGWSYAMPLFLSLQIQSALTHLASQPNPRGLLQATHLALFLHQRAIPLHDIHTNNNDDNDNNDTPTAEGTDPLDFHLLQSLLVAYASKWQRKASPVPALEYLLYIPDKQTPQLLTDDHRNKIISKAAQTQICRLIVETKAYSDLAGNVAPDGSRDHTHHSALDKHLSKPLISNLLAQAAEDTFHKGNVVDAAQLLALAGHYSSLMSLLNRQLASLLDEQQQQQQPQEDHFWRTAALNFYNTHLSNGRTHVLQTLEQEGTLHLGNTFQLILNLLVFYDRCHDKEWQHAWDIMDGLEVFPKSESQMSIKVESFFALATEIKQMFHNVVLKAMESLYFQYESLKSERGFDVNTNQATQQRISELKSRARLLVTFTGLLHLNCSSDIKARFARMEAFMI